MFTNFHELIAPLAILGMIWVLVLYQIYKGPKRGELTYWRGRARICRRAEEPKGFWSLFCFYVLIAVVLPIAVACALVNRGAP
jgi:hypothetical protein